MQGPLSNGFNAGSPERQNTWSSNDWALPSSAGGVGAMSSSRSAVSLLDEQNVPAFYDRAWQAAQADDQSAGYVTFGSLKRVLQAGEVKQSVQDKILSLISSDSIGDSRFDRQQFHTATALLALAQSGKTVSIDSVIANKDNLPTPNLPSSFTDPPARAPQLTRGASDASIDPWSSSGQGSRLNASAPPLYTSGLSSIQDEAVTQPGFGEELANGFRGVGETQGWALGPQDKCTVEQSDQMGGWILHHTVWTVTFNKTGSQVERRYNDFVWLHDCFVQRYPFRLLPALPPKRVAVQGRHLATDDLFLERRRRGLERFLTYSVNHPVLKQDGLLKTFLTEPDLVAWRKSTPVSLQEEAYTRTLTASEEMSIPSDLEDRLHQLKGRIVMLVDHWSRIVQTYDRIAHRRRNQAVDMIRFQQAVEGALEVERSGWRLGEVESVESMQEIVAGGMAKQGEIVGASATLAIETTVEELKRHRELYVHFRDLFIRHSSLSPDSVDKIKKKTEANLKKLEALRSSTKPNASEQADALVQAIEKDQIAVESMLSRRVFIRYCMWQELVFLWRSTSLLDPSLRALVKNEISFAERLVANAKSTDERLSVMSSS